MMMILLDTPLHEGDDDDMKHTPGYLMAFLTVHVTSQEINEALKKQLLQEGMIEPSEGYGYFCTTAKGVAFVEMLRDVPLPVQKWVDPRGQ